MKAILRYLRDFFRETWNPRYYFSVLGLLVVAFVLNYGFDFETRALREFNNPLSQFFFYLFFYSLPYVLTVLLGVSNEADRAVLRDRKFWLALMTVFAIVAMYISTHNLPWYLYRVQPSILQPVPATLHHYAIRYLTNLVPGILLVLFVGMYWYRVDRKRMNFYGISTAHITLTTYVALLLILVPVVIAASYSADFQQAYPRYKFGFPFGAGEVERLLLISGFQFCYGLDFVAVEFLFRGFMVLALVRFLGAKAILPMVVVYALIHFQKPMGEALGSIVGGLVLGVISMRTGSIYGGVILHLGIAYMMEMAGAFQMVSR